MSNSNIIAVCISCDTIIVYCVPVSGFAVHREPCASGRRRNNRCRKTGPGSDIEVIDLRGHYSGARGLRLDKRYSKILCKRLHNISCDHIDIVSDPGCVFVVVMISDLGEH